MKRKCMMQRVVRVVSGRTVNDAAKSSVNAKAFEFIRDFHECMLLEAKIYCRINVYI